MIRYAYIHIPFCKRKCRYCSFVSGINIKTKKQYIKALLTEIKQRYNKKPLKTLYLGGGTPSLLDVNEIEEILSLFKFYKNPEITIEVNPETVELSKFLRLKEIGVNRLSLGIQTFNNNILRIIGRNHTEDTIYKAIEIIKQAGFKNISIDLIYGLPEQNVDLLKEDLNKVIKLDIQHISLYGLKIEENSYFYKNIPNNIPNEDIQAEMFLYICKYLQENEFEHYEISNFSKKGYKSKHNCAYWKNKNYYGFGLNASGFEENIRYRNTKMIKEYLNNPLKREEEYQLSKQENMENEIFLALRLKEGIKISNINKKYNIDFEEKYKKIIDKYKKIDLLSINKERCFLTEKGFLLSNEIMSEFID